MRYQSTVGLAPDQIEELVGRIEQVLACRVERPWPPCIDTYHAVLMTLVYVRQNLNQAAVGEWFGYSQSTVSRTYRATLPLIGEALCLHVPDLAEAIRDRIVLVDGTDVPTGNRAGHRDNYSGKRHRSGLNVQVASGMSGVLLGVSDPAPGSTHDRKAFADCTWEHQLANIPTIADPGYQGTRVIHPRKKPNGGELSEGDKDNNKNISAIRSAVERCIAHWKNWKILATGYRGRLTELPTVIRIITALECYRLGWMP